jgi:LacI family transcriptional regulator
MLKRPNIVDVARLAGVSPTAVSRWLNGSIQLPAATGDRIRNAVSALDYRAHAQARRLSRGTADAVGIVVPDIANPFFARLAGEAERVAVGSGYDVVIWSSRNRVERELACFDRLAAGYIDGLLLITNHEDDGSLARLTQASRGRVVIVDEDVRGTEVPKFFVKNETGGYAATQHLLQCGHKRIAHIGGPKGVMSAAERAQGWRRALADSGIVPPDEWHVCSEYEIEPARVDGLALFALDPMPTAIFAGSDAIALGVMSLARERSVKSPADLSLVGFDGMPIAELLGPPLTSVEQPIDSLGSLGAARLVALIEGKGLAEEPVETVRLDVALVERGSVAPPKDRSH